MLAWVATLLLVAQPALAQSMMGPVKGETITVELCTSHGTTVKAVELPGPAKAADCEKCVHCLAAPMAAGTTQPAARAVSFHYSAVRFADGRFEVPATARAPPRPPGQGPPRQNV
jgi:hypothetical protein